MNRILVIGSHFDDIELGCAGMLLRNKQQDTYVCLVVICDEKVPNREQHTTMQRETVFRENAKELGASEVICLYYPSNKLVQIDSNKIIGQLIDIINRIKPITVYTHLQTDINQDHRVTSDITQVACRPRVTSPVNKLYEYYIPGSSDWRFNKRSLNVCVNITDQMEDKLRMCKKYKTELRESPDPFSIDKMKCTHEYHGSIFGYKYAEMFNLVFERTI